ncbi:MAG: RDD family protein [Chitinophagaceae bacterium]|nr:RDD family protein [Oligoflexus sp.]
MSDAQGENVRVVNGISLYHSLNEDFSVYEPAQFRERMLGHLSDYFLLGVTIALLRLPFLKLIEHAKMNGQEAKSSAITTFLFLLAVTICQLAPLCLWGQTLGKYLFGIRVITMTGGARLSPLNVITREVGGKFVSMMILGVGFLFPLWRADKRALHDLLSDTKVVKYRR